MTLRAAALRIAMITPYLPSPANTGGRIRMYRLARALARIGDVSLYARVEKGEAAAPRERDELVLYRTVRTRHSDIGVVPPLVTARRVRRSCPLRLAYDLLRDHRAAPFDVLVVEHSYATATARLIPLVPMVLDEHNIESRYLSEYLTARSRGHCRLAQREVKLLSVWERRAWLQAAVVTCVTESDARVIRAHRDGPVHVIPNGVAVDEIPFVLPSQRSGAEVLFVGLMSHAPNVSAARFLALEVMPRVWSREPSARLVLCGRSPCRDVQALRNDRVEVTGTVSSVVPFLSRAAVYANALFQGAGSSLKVPEALASGVPLVSTAIGVRGFPLVPMVHYAPAEDADSFADHIVAALRARHSLDERARQGRAVAERFDWERIAQDFVNVVTSVVGRSKRV